MSQPTPAHPEPTSAPAARVKRPVSMPNLIVTIVVLVAWLIVGFAHPFLSFLFIGGDCFSPECEADRKDWLGMLYLIVPPILFVITAAVSIVLLIKRGPAMWVAIGGAVLNAILVVVCFVILTTG